MDTDQDTESIKSLVEHICKDNVVLPEFQRDFVWDESKTYDLFDSLIRDIFVGSLIYGIPSFDITVRSLDDRPRKGAGSRAKPKLTNYLEAEMKKKVQSGTFRLLLDGQQRATSICRALLGIDPVWITFKSASEFDSTTKSRALGERSLEEVLFAVVGEESPERLSLKMSDVYDMLQGKIHRESEKASILEASKFWKANPEPDIQKSEVFEQFLAYSTKLQDMLKAEKLLSYYMLNTNAEKFALFFERSNSKGMQLSFIDILSAKLYQGFNLRQKIDDFEEENPQYFLNREGIVRAIAFIQSDGKDIGKNYILANLTHVHFTEHWDRLCVLYKKCVDFLTGNHFILSQSWMPSQSMIIPLLVFLREVPHNDFSQIDETQRRFIQYWYWLAIFSERYSGQADSKLLADANSLRLVARKDYSFGVDYFRRFVKQVETTEDLLAIHKKSSAIYKGILNVVNFGTKGLVDWTNTGKLSLTSPLDDHHIFPREYLRKELGIDAPEDVDCVVNRTLIPKITNISIGKKTPSDYLGELKMRNAHIVESLTNHLIPDDIISGAFDKEYQKFLENRAGKIMEVISAIYENGDQLLEAVWPNQSKSPSTSSVAKS